MMEPTFVKPLVRLAEARVKFILVGGLAVTLQGYVRFTEDVDMLIDANLENIELLLATLANYGKGFASELSVDDFTNEEGAIRIVEEVEQRQLDIFTRMSSRVYDDASIYEI